MYKKMQFSLI